MKNFKNKKKTISTKDLYLLELYKCTKVKEDIGKFSEISTGVYVLGYKDLFDKYKDAFTGTEYVSEFYRNTIEVGKQRVHIVSPIISNKSEISYEEALGILETHNFYLIDRDCKGKTKELLELMRNFNMYSAIEPEKAEAFAEEVLKRINAHPDQMQEKIEGVNNDELDKALVIGRKKK